MHNLPSLPELLTSGGDARIECDAQGRNKYGCYSTVQPDMLAFGSSTASTISEEGFAASAKLYEALALVHSKGEGDALYAQQMQRVAQEFATLCGLDSLPGTEIVLGASGTDMHHYVAQLLHAEKSSLLVIMPQESETGTGVKAALKGDGAVQVVAVNSRLSDGTLRAEIEVDKEVEALAMQSIHAGGHVLVVLTDISKTGLITPGPSCARSLQQRFAPQVDILVDGCQFRLNNASLRDYLELGWMVALTGSKFVTGPAFCSALLIPEPLSQRWPAHPLPATNYGLLLRFEAALTQLRSFQQLPEKQVMDFLTQFASEMRAYLESNPVFVPIIPRDIKRFHQSWDSVTTIFPFLLRHPKTGTLFSHDETRQLYKLLQEDLSRHPSIPLSERPLAAKRCLLGQPVNYSPNASALRINMDMRLITDTLSGRGADVVIRDVKMVLDKTALLATQLFT